MNLDTIIGPRIAGDLTTNQTSIVLNHIHQNEDGVRRVAAQILANPNTRNPTPVLLAALSRGQHLANPRDEKQRRKKQNALDTAEAAYHAKIAHLNETGTLEPEGSWTQYDAIAYAIDYTDGANEDTETLLRERLGIPTRNSVPAPEAWKALLRRLTTEEPQP